MEFANGLILETRIQSWKKFTNRGNLVKPIPARFLARFGYILGVKVQREHDWLDTAWGRVLGLATNTIKHKTTWRKITNKNYKKG
jgi:hypothetical protein